ALFGVCMVCHGELVRLRPTTRHLTEFYLMLSAGGALGGVFVSLVAPHVFQEFFEWDIGLVISFVLALTVAAISFGKKKASRLAVGGAALAIGVLGMAGITYSRWIEDTTDYQRLAIARNFYGVVAVIEREADNPERHHR